MVMITDISGMAVKTPVNSRLLSQRKCTPFHKLHLIYKNNYMCLEVAMVPMPISYSFTLRNKLSFSQIQERIIDWLLNNCRGYDVFLKFYQGRPPKNPLA